MVYRNSLDDRRQSLRFDVTGGLWASFDMTERVLLRNVTPHGVLVESRMSAALRSLRSAEIAFGDGHPTLHVVVRHVTPVSDAPEDDRYLIGLEFVNVSPTDRLQLDRLVRAWEDHGGA